MRSIVYLGMDVHQDFIELVGLGEKGNEVLYQGRVKNNYRDLKGYIGELSRVRELHCCYEASSCGYVVYRWLKEWGIECQVIAPSLKSIKLLTRPSISGARYIVPEPRGDAIHGVCIPA